MQEQEIERTVESTNPSAVLEGRAPDEELHLIKGSKYVFDPCCDAEWS